MSLQEKITKILETSINAPSGSNSQPWSFQAKDEEILVFAHPEKDHPVLNFRNRGTWLAHGALIENIKIAAEAQGFKAEIKIFPDSANPNLTGQIKLSEGQPTEEGLFQVIPQRTTNRKRYDLKPLTSEQKKYLVQPGKEVIGNMRVVWVEDRNKIERLAKAAAASEIVTLENKKLHQLFFNEIVWTRKEEQKKMKGLFIKTMELKPPEELFLRLFKRWSIMKTFAKLGFARKIAFSNAKNYANTPVMGLVVLKDDDKEFLLAGRLIERIWLKATIFGFGFHLITGTMFFWQGINLGGLKLFSDEHREIINEEYQTIANIGGISSREELVTAIFRLGSAPAPTARSSKKPPEIRYIE